MIEERSPIMDHLEELRWRLVKSAAGVALGSVIAFFFHEQLLAFLTQPYDQVVGDDGLVFTEPTEAFSVVMRVSLLGGVLLASPVLIYQTWAFVSPALTLRERRYVLPLVGLLAILFWSGVAFAYWSLTRALEFLLTFGGESLRALITIRSYLSFATRFLLVFGFAFEFPVFIFAAALVGMVSSAQLARGRRWAVLVIVIVGAIITPSGDPLTLAVLSVPLYLLYEGTIWVVRLGLNR
ncbi:MAG: twin-arginine translocase subunit TatC [Actinomycetota bacterium]|nr:twin-arginine translocase subunit TatC [Actinomycetota bacterium]